ncbi:MAG: DUF2652 domain-containing protein [Chloroflexota bacterium]|nr:DUF2652 domain-containing protein [Chloroflexota bacterium]
MTSGYRSQQGYLVLADISGYTAFLTGTEIEHAQGIIHELTTLIRDRLAPPMRFVKLEGDAVFCYADDAAFPDGERLIELLEVCYFEFSNRLLNMARAATCHCNACASIDSLGLKFIAHFGSYVIQHDGGRDDLAGADVILVHRLLKNAISDAGGPPAYAFFSDACLEKMPAAFELPKHVETYESFGETTGGVHDLEPVLREMRESQREYISSAEADLEVSLDVPAPPAVVWGYMVDPLQRWRWEGRRLHKTPDEDERNARGRTGLGATSHCTHAIGEAMREIIDWRPYSYQTVRGTSRFYGGFVTAGRMTETVELTPTDDGGTLIHLRIRLTDRGAFSKFAFAPVRFLMKRGARDWQSNWDKVIDEDGLGRAPAGAPDEPRPTVESA